MIVENLYGAEGIKTISKGEGARKIKGVFCCDMLSVAMSKAPAGACWVTVVSNLNTLAVASLTDCSCVVIAGGVAVGEDVKAKAESEGISLFTCDEPVFETALMVHNLLHVT